jgi:hypothetical protein
LVLALAGKTIEISFDSLPTGVNIVWPTNVWSVILDLGDNVRVVTKVNWGSRSYICYWWTSATEFTNDCKNPPTWSPFKITDNWFMTINIDIRNMLNWVRRFVIWNRYNLLNQSINNSIKYIKIYQS